MRIDKKIMTYWLTPINRIFRDFKDNTLDYDNRLKRRIFIDNNSDVLLVAHLDTVLKPRFLRHKKNKIYASGLDDRLGCMVAYRLAAQLKADLLLTDLEESAKTTAKHHDCKKYNWIAEFDRMGDDVVTYDCDNVEFRDVLKEQWKIGFGSYSDISSLVTKACCVNVGIGYKNAHDKNSSVCLNTLSRQIDKFIAFFELHKNTSFERDETIRQRYGVIGYTGNYYAGNRYCSDNLIDEDINDCEMCGSVFTEKVYGHFICEACFETMFKELWL